MEKGKGDRAWWMLETNGNFTIKSAWDCMRIKKEKRREYDFIWANRIPFKISFFLWRFWKRRIATDDNLKRMRIQQVSRCWCCEEGKQETVSHLFLTAPIATKLWKLFATCAGINIDGMHLQQVIIKWWTMEGN